MFGKIKINGHNKNGSRIWKYNLLRNPKYIIFFDQKDRVQVPSILEQASYCNRKSSPFKRARNPI